MAEKGTVVRVFYEEDRKYMFIKPDSGGKPVFAHFNDFRPPYWDEVDNEVTFEYMTPDELHRPRHRDRVVFERDESRNGKPKAFPWTTEDLWRKVEETIEEQHALSEKVGQHIPRLPNHYH